MFSDNSEVKIELAVAKGRKDHDKIQALMDKDDKREVAKAVGRRSKVVE